MKRIFLFYAAIMMVSGCTAIKVSPDSMKENGLLVAQVYGTHVFKPGKSTASLQVDGTWMQSLGDGDTLVAVLPPGKHKIEAIRISIRPNTMEYPLSRELEIEKGKITSLGTAYPYFAMTPGQSLARNVPDDRYVLYWLPHNEELEQEVNKLYPDLRNMVSDTRFYQAPGNYLTDSELEGLRRNIAVRELNGWGINSSHDVVGGDLGTIAIYDISKDIKLKKLTILPSKTLRSINNCMLYKEDTICSIPLGHEMAVARNGKVNISELPAGFTGRVILPLSDNKILIGDDQFAMYLSRDDGLHWELLQDKKLSRPVTPGYGVWMAESVNGYYLYSADKDGTVIHVQSDGSLSQVNVGKMAGNFNSLAETTDGLYLGMRTKSNEHGKVYFRPTGSDEWHEREIPESGCFRLVNAYEDKKAVQIKCNNKHLQTADGGITWVTK